MAKKMTLKERAVKAARAAWPSVGKGDLLVVKGTAIYLAGHRANRLTARERAVVKAAAIWRKDASGQNEVKLCNAVDALARAKGGAR
ncbi:MAG: hypothetical protein INF12_14500 [Methylobacterium sp.]|nr:hypothetical protein [Methylobacterium sp.]